MLSHEAAKQLLIIARRSVEAAVRGHRPPNLHVSNPELQRPQGAFVTLRKDGQLRGCIGRFEADEPLWEVVRDMAVAAATQDPRFFGMRLEPGDISELTIEVSVLSPLRKTKDPLRELELGKHGIQARRGFRTGCFLPQVATETGWSKEEFLCQCCAGKAGLEPYAWQQPDTDIYLFTAQIIKE